MLGGRDKTYKSQLSKKVLGIQELVSQWEQEKGNQIDPSISILFKDINSSLTKISRPKVLFGIPFPLRFITLTYMSFER